MKITRSVKVCRGNMKELEQLDCLAFIKTDEKDKRHITCRLKNSATQGFPVAHTGEYLVQYETGMWQRVGAGVYASLVFKPSK